MDTLNIIIFVFFLALGYMLVTYRKNRKSEKYDERQAVIRGRGYKYAFIAIAVSDFLLLFLVDNLNVKMTPVFFVIGSAFDWMYGVYWIYDFQRCVYCHARKELTIEFHNFHFIGSMRIGFWYSRSYRKCC